MLFDRDGSATGWFNVQPVITVLIVAAYVAVLTTVALRARGAGGFGEFSVARRTLPLALVFGSLSATYVGPAYSIGFVGRGFQSGLIFLIIGLAFTVQNVLVAQFVAPRLRALPGCYTLGDVIGLKYSRGCQVIAGLISVGLCTMFGSVMAKAGGVIITDIVDLPMWSAVVVVVGVTALYTTFGGLRASVVTDAFQFTTFAVLLPGVFVWLLLRDVEASSALFSRELLNATRDGWTSMTPVEILGWITAFFLGETLIPPIANRALASKNIATSRNGFLLAGGFSVIWFTVMIGLGVLARGLISGQAPEEDQVLLSLVHATLSTEWYALILVVLISIIMSSLDSLLNAGAVAFTQDLVRPLRKIDDGQALAIGRCATVFLALVAVALGIWDAGTSVLVGLSKCYSIWAPAILPALILGLWIKRPVPLAGMLSMVGGTVTALVFIAVFTFGVPDVPDVLAILPALCVSLLGYLVGHVLGQSQEGSGI